MRANRESRRSSIVLTAGFCFLLSCLSWGFAREKPPGHPKMHKQPDSAPQTLAEELPAAVRRPGLRPVPVRNFIDELVFAKMQKDGIPHAGLSTDAEFVRRIHLDLTGRLPEPDVVRQFLAEPDAAKREKLIDKLMATPIVGHLNKPETPFLDRWTYFFGDLFRVSAAELGPPGRNLFRDYLYLALLANLPYDEMVHEMLTASARSNWLSGPANFLTRDHVDDFDDLQINAEDTFDEAAITTTKVFLGVDLECVSCHDGAGHLEKIHLWLTGIEREQVWRQAAFFSDLRIARSYSIDQEMAVLQGKPGYDLTSRSVRRMPRYEADVEPRFLLTGERPRAGEPWREAYARMLTEHPQFARATVNLIWAELMGVGIVNPPLQFDLARQNPAAPPPSPWKIQPSHPELLDALAQDFQAHKFDLRHLIRLVVNSSTYQLSSNFEGEWKDAYTPYSAKHFVRRLSAEEIGDAISQATGIFDSIPINGSAKKVKYVLQTYSPEDLGPKPLEPLRQFLTLLGQGKRVSVEKNRTWSMLNSAALMNSPFVKERVEIKEGGRLAGLLNQDPPLSNGEIVDELFLAFLSRFPRPEEKVFAIQEVLEPRHGQGLSDLAWSLINKPEFVLNY